MSTIGGIGLGLGMLMFPDHSLHILGAGIYGFAVATVIRILDG